MPKEASLLFSGGIDSMYAALTLSKEYDKVHLLNYCNGYGHIFMNETRRRYHELKKKTGNKFCFHQESVKTLFEQVLINNITSEMNKYSSAFIWCLACKLCMHATTIVYGNSHNIKRTFDGSSYETQEMVEQSPFCVGLIKKLYERYGIRYEPAAYLVSRKEKIHELKSAGISTGIHLMNRNIGIQPKCIPGELYYSPYVLFGRPPNHQQREVYAFYRDKIPLIDEHIKRETGKLPGMVR